MYWPERVDQTALPELLPLSTESTVNSLPWLGEYCAYYGIDYEKDYDGLRHYIGYVEVGQDRLATQVFSLPGARYTAVVVHGYYDHVGLFNNVIEYCLRHECSVVAFVLPGHGLSSGERASIDSFQRYRQALVGVLGEVGGFNLPTTQIAIGQSTGCAVLGSHLLDGGGEDFAKVVLLAPLVRPCGWRSGSLVYPFVRLFMSSLPRRFADNSDDQAFLEFLRERDPLQPRILPLDWVGALRKWLPWFEKLPSTDTEVLIIQGDADETVDWRYNLPVLRKKYRQLSEVLIPGARHHLVKEGEAYRALVWQACDDFLFDSKS